LKHTVQFARQTAEHTLETAGQRLKLQRQLLLAFDPQAALGRGYALVRIGQKIVRSGRELQTNDELHIKLRDADVTAAVKRVTMEKK
jgi:exonuclease VII large subunit